jgi:hypothetical protein
MIQIVLDTYDGNEVGVDDGLYSHPKNERFMVLSYDSELDHNLVIDLERFLLKRQPKCEACVHYKKEGAFCGYCASYCDCTDNHIEMDNNCATHCDKYEFNEKYLTEFYE